METPRGNVSAGNRFDRLQIDVAELYRAFPLGGRAAVSHSNRVSVAALYRTPWLPLRARLGLWKLLHRLRLDQAWFDQFAEYWGAVLGGRPLRSPDDFHFLRNTYRARFQASEVSTVDDDVSHLAAWQQPDVIYMLFNQVFVESLSLKTRIVDALQQHVPHGRCLDFGCGVGSLAHTDDILFRGRRTWVMADVETIALHYAGWRFGQRAGFSVRSLTPGNAFALPAGPFEAICCVTVFEHLPHPLETARQMAAALSPGGHLIFDYILSSGDGMDTVQAVQERPAVLAFMRERFDVISGELDETRSMGLTILRKKP